METETPKSHALINGVAIGLTIAALILLGFTYYLVQKSKDVEIEYLQALVAKKPEMPISVTTRQALTGAGLVAQFTNHSDKFLAVVVTFKNPTTGQEKSGRLDLAPRAATEVGHLEGWTFASGDKISIQHNDYESLIRLVN